MLDVVLAATGLVVMAPLLAAAVLGVRLTSPGPVLYRGERVGRGGRPFSIFKIRTMYVGSDQQGPPITRGGDARVTRVGRLLRRTKLDELPQLLNVVRGEMSLVGPRPEHPEYVALYSTDQQRLLSLRPGITGAAAVAFSHEERLLARPDAERYYRQVLMPAKLQLELDYLANRSLLLDLRLLMATIARIAKPSGLNLEPPLAPPSPRR